jgi:Helix-turn-helix of DDE superfamily endonuclease
MLKYEQMKGKELQFKSLAGMSVEEFDWLHNDYEVEWNSYIAHYTLSGVPRIRSHRVRKDGKPESSQDQLLFILHYLKSNALQEHHGATYGMSQPQVNLWIHLLLMLLRKTLKSAGELPERRAGKIKELLSQTEQVFMDGTERDIQRPGDFEEQKEHYSGKKKHIK